MESSKHMMKSDSGSSEESDQHQEQVKDDVGNTTKRSYECTYCKRGFTNAQALGGHMNIHRKDRAKAKQNQQHANSSVPKTPNEDYSSSRSYISPMISGEHAKYDDSSEAQRNYILYSRMLSSTNCPPPQGVYPEGDFSGPMSNTLHGVGANLSLRIGSPYRGDREVIMRVEDDQEKDDVDLELRLGPDP